MNGPRNPLLSSIVLVSLLKGLERELRKGKPDGAQQNTPKPLSLEEILRGAPGAPGLLTPAELEALLGMKKDEPCDCIVCTLRRGAESPAAPAAADGSAEVPQHIAKTFEIGEDVAALVGLTPSMLDDTPDEPTTVLRINAASFISTLRAGYAAKETSSMAHSRLGELAEQQALAGLKIALAALGE